MLGLTLLPLLGVGLLLMALNNDDDTVDTPDPVEPPETPGEPTEGSVFNGTADDDQIEVHVDNATVNGGAGDDELITDSRYDGNVLNGDAGNDTIASFGSSTANGGIGDDRLSGSGTLNGGAGDDELIYYSGAHADGGEGNDFIRAASGLSGSGPVTVNGGDGDDTIGIAVTEYTDPEEGALRSFSGGAGNDTFAFSYNSADTDIGLIARIEDFDPAQDRLELDLLGGQLAHSSHLQLNDVTFAEADDGSYTDLILSITAERSDEASDVSIRLEGVAGLTMDNLTFVDPNGEVLNPGFDDATGTDDSGVSVVSGTYNTLGGGNDTVTGDGGGAFTQLGDGDDLYQVDGAQNSTVSGGDGNDTIEAGPAGGNALYLGGAGDDVLSVDHDTAEVSGGTGDDTVLIGGDDILADGGSGDDVFIAQEGSGPDVLFRGGTGSDSFTIRAGQTAIDTPDLSDGTFVVNIAEDEVTNGFATILKPAGGSSILLNIDPAIEGDINVVTYSYESPLGEPLQEFAIFVGDTQVLQLTTAPIGSNETIYANENFDFDINRAGAA
ncbi:calcium-binding protein [Sulfitobacter sp. PR48]|uniref:calcium-binding protein n=1 Tax=Sulfitobacter sp. PR48 TaxID=3028383 RepID=UPI00237AE06E|nr:calcium-binding protein [Sulfitobacter sp. PR48]MDD9720101.1 calcium-binding protein [Sulfitobacter sp. PR48]